MIKFEPNSIQRIKYTNWKGNTRVRSILVLGLVYGNNKYHPEEQWLVEAIDCEDRQVKFFAMKDMVPCLD